MPNGSFSFLSTTAFWPSEVSGRGMGPRPAGHADRIRALGTANAVLIRRGKTNNRCNNYFTGRLAEPGIRAEGLTDRHVQVPKTGTWDVCFSRSLRSEVQGLC